MSEDDKEDLSNIATINVQKTNPSTYKNSSYQNNSINKNGGSSQQDYQPKSKIQSQDITNNVINNQDVRKDFFNTEIVKKGKKHKVTWADKAKKQQLTNVAKVESYKNYNLGIQSIQIGGREDKEDNDETVRCKCLVF